MTKDKLLDQEEIDMLMRSQMAGDDGASEEEPVVPVEQPDVAVSEVLTPEEKDALGEIGNISMGSASTTLSELLGQKVSITSPEVQVTSKFDLINSFNIPYLIIKVVLIEGIEGFNMLVMKVEDARVVADLMMGGEGKPSQEAELSEMDISAASEAMNMMIGSASTALSQMFKMPFNISPPTSTLLKSAEETKENDILPEVADDGNLVVVSFDMTIGDLVDTEIMQVLSVPTAQKEADLLLQGLEDMVNGQEDTSTQPELEEDDVLSNDEIDDLIKSLEAESEDDTQVQSAQQPAPEPAPVTQPTTATPAPRNLDLILDIPLNVSVILGRTHRPIKEVLNIGPGSVVELQSLADEPVDILVNGMLVAEGEVVVVNENFGVKITHIISPEERVKRLAE